MTKTRAQVKWDSFTLPLSNGNLGIIDPKAQYEALITELLMRRLSPGATLEGNPETPHGPNPTPSPCQRSKEP